MLIGGVGEDHPLASAFIKAAGAYSKPVSGILHRAREWHSATLLADGTVLVLGGVGVNGQLVAEAERFDPQTEEFMPLVANEMVPRAYHTATLLMDGRVLIAGGVSNRGNVIRQIELFDPQTGAVQVLRPRLKTPRYNHRATLLASGDVLLWGGTSEDGKPLVGGELISFANAARPGEGQTTVVPVNRRPEERDGNAALAGALPMDGAVNVSLDTRIALRFSHLLQVETVNDYTATLAGPFGLTEVKVVAAENGRLVFITPTAPLLPGFTYTVHLSGMQAGETQVAPLMLTFVTASAPLLDPPDDELWRPDLARGDWRTGRKDSPWQSLLPLQAAPGVTALAGQVLTLNGQPLPNVTLLVGERQARTDRTGRFLLEGLQPGRQRLLMDGRTANRGRRVYGVFEESVEITEGKTTALTYTIWMPRLDMANAVTIASPTATETVITTPHIPGLEVRLPAGTAIYDHEGKRVTRLSITPIPVDRPPFPLPEGVQVPIYFTVQPGGSYVRVYDASGPKGARIHYPNYTRQPAGERADFWHYDPRERGWYVYGRGAVTADARQVIPDEGVAVYAFTGAMIGFGGFAPDEGPPPDGESDGDPVDLFTGLFVYKYVDLLLPDVMPVMVARTYRTRDSRSRQFGRGSTHPYQMFLTGDGIQFSFADFILPDGGRIHYERISPGNSFGNAVMEHTETQTVFYKSQLRWSTADSAWNLRLTDGTVYVFGDSAPLQAIRDRYGNQVKIIRQGSENTNIKRVTSPNGRWIDFTYDSQDRITQLTDNIGRTVTYTYDTDGRLWKVTNPVNGVTEYTYDSSHRMLTIKDARGIVYLTNEYDANGRVIRQTQADNGVFEFDYTLDSNGKVIQTEVTDPRGNVRRVTFNGKGFALTDTYAVGTSLQQTYTYERESGTNFVLSVTDPLNRKTEFTYDSFGNVTSVTRLADTSEAVTTAFTYEPIFHQLATVTDPLNHTTTFSYDSHGNLVSVTDPLQHEITIGYNAAGLPTSFTDALDSTYQLTYDRGDLVGVTNPLGHSLTRFVDAAGRMLTLTNAVGQMARYEYDALNRLTKMIDPLGSQTLFAYDANGNVESVTDARNGVTSYVYDDMDQVETRRDALLHDDLFEYDLNGNLKKVTDRKSQVTSFTYDTLDRLTLVTYADSSTTSYSYDAGNRLMQVADSISGTISYTYDNLSRVLSETTPQGTVSYAYDDAGRRTSMTVAGQSTVNYTYDNASRLTQITQGSSTVTFTYDDADRRTSMTLPNGVSVEYDYDAASQITSITYKQGATTLGDLTYVYDPTGRVASVGGSFARTALPQALGSATYNAANQQTGFGGRTLTYDLNGNLPGDGSNTYTWDARNQLVGISGPGLTASFAYDGFGRRIARTVNGATVGFLYDGVDVVQELTGGTPSASITVGGVDEVLVRTDGSCSCSALRDLLGSVVALTNGSGAVQTEYTYEPFGKTTASGTASSNPSQFTGRENDAATELYYYRARYYAPHLQRFISEDPLGFAGHDPNLYAYVFNSPTTFTDPSGRLAVLAFAKACLAGALIDVAINVTADYLTGRKITPGKVGQCALAGCVSGIFGYGLGKALGWGLPKAGRYLAGLWRRGGKGSASAADDAAEAGGRRFTVTKKGVVFEEGIQGTSSRVGDWTDIQGASVREALSRIPRDWLRDDTQRGGGGICRDPANPRFNWVRIMPGNGSPYLRIFRNGSYVDEFGNKVPRNAPSGHIPLTY